MFFPVVAFYSFFPPLPPLATAPPGPQASKNMGGLLVPSWYRSEDPSTLSFALVSFLFGFSSACAAFTAVTILVQTHRTWKRSRKLLNHPYIAMIVTEWVSSWVISVVSYLFIVHVIPPRSVCPAPPKPPAPRLRPRGCARVSSSVAHSV